MPIGNDKRGELLTDSRKVLSLEVGKLTDPGKIRHHLVDSLGFYKPDDPDLLYSKGELFLVADGIGGHELGAQAARLATDLIIKNYFDKSADADIEATLKHAFNLANMRIIEQNQENSGTLQAGTSVTCAVIQRGTLHVAHVGNCRLYLIKGNKIKQLTHDHISREDANLPLDLRKTGAKFRVSRALGWVPGVEIDYFAQSLKPNDCLLLCTDGLFQMLDNQEIGRLALKYSPQAACEKFIATANEKGGPDNITNILIKINGLITISESFAQNQNLGINLVLPATQPTQPEEHYPGATFRIGGFQPGFAPEEPEDVESPSPPLWEMDEEPESEPFPEPVRKHLPEKIFPEPEEPEEAPRISTPRPFLDERHEPASSTTEASPTNPAAAGMRRRRFVATPAKTVDYQKLFKSGFFVLVALTIFIAGGYLLVSERGNKTEPTISESDMQKFNSFPQDPNRSESVPEVEQPPANLEVQAGAGIATVELTMPLKVVLLNGNHLSKSSVQRLQTALKSAGLSLAQFENLTVQPSPGSRTKILYRFPTDGNAQPIRDVAKRIQQTIQSRYQKEIEITHCDLTLIIGKDLRMNAIKIQDLRRKILETQQINPIHLEILNGSGRAGFGDRIKSILEDLLIDDEHYLKIIDVRNAATFDYSNTLLKCRSSKITVASKLADILGLPTISRSIVIDDLEDIQLVLGRDFD
jgi:protein phosphatase